MTAIEGGFRRARVVLGRLREAMGWTGALGLALLVVAAAIGFGAWTKRVEAAVSPVSPHDTAVLNSSPLTSEVAAATVPMLQLTKVGDIPLVLTRIERAVTDSGLPWTAGDYRVNPASDREAGSFEVRCTFKAPYPKVRALVAALIGSLPAMTFREMSFARSSIDSPDVDAKLSVVVFLADEAPPTKAVGDR